MTEYRQNDLTVGYCPKCGAQLVNITMSGKGYCELHGWVFADWKPRP